METFDFLKNNTQEFISIVEDYNRLFSEFNEILESWKELKDLGDVVVDTTTQRISELKSKFVSIRERMNKFTPHLSNAKEMIDKIDVVIERINNIEEEI